MKTILLATAATIIATSAQADATIFAKPNSITVWKSPKPYASIVSGGPPESTNKDGGIDANNLSPVVAQAHGDNERVFLITRQPYERYTVGSADFLILDGESGIIEKLTVVITPTGQPMRPMDMIQDGQNYTVWCSGAHIGCLPALRRKEPTAEETTRHRDGSTTYRKEYN
jgi:hypothetical protein